MGYEIRSDIPLPAIRGRGPKYPYRDLGIGESFFVPGVLANLLTASKKYWSEKLDREFTVRSIEGGVRVWRIR